MKHIRTLLLILFSLGAASADAVIQAMVGLEGPAREPEGNEEQTWLGLQYTHPGPVLWKLHPFAKGMVSLRDNDILLTAGLALVFQPMEEVPEFRVSIQTGPSFANTGPPHTGSDLNWTSEAQVCYKSLMVGYSHTSNGGLDFPNSGLDLVLFGIRFEL